MELITYEHEILVKDNIFFPRPWLQQCRGHCFPKGGVEKNEWKLNPYASDGLRMKYGSNRGPQTFPPT